MTYKILWCHSVSSRVFLWWNIPLPLKEWFFCQTKDLSLAETDHNIQYFVFELTTNVVLDFFQSYCWERKVCVYEILYYRQDAFNTYNYWWIYKLKMLMLTNFRLVLCSLKNTSFTLLFPCGNQEFIFKPFSVNLHQLIPIQCMHFNATLHELHINGI